MTGLSQIDYRAIKTTRAGRPGPGCVLTNLSITGGKLITAGVTLAKGLKDQPMIVDAEGSFRSEILALKKVYVIFFDDQERRGWLVDGASAILHLLRAQLENDAFHQNGHFSIDDFQYLYANGDAGDVDACATLLRNRYTRVDEDYSFASEIVQVQGGEPVRTDKRIVKTWTVEMITRRIIHLLIQIVSHQQKFTNPHLRGTLREKLEGWSMKDVIDSDFILHPRALHLSSSGNGWVALAQDIGAVTLFGRGIGEILVPRPSHPCRFWTHVPCGEDYLATTVPILRQICADFDDKMTTQALLTASISWHQTSQLFEPCQGSTSDSKHKCDRVQSLFPVNSIGKCTRPSAFYDEANAKGAVIFGRVARF